MMASKKLRAMGKKMENNYLLLAKAQKLHEALPVFILPIRAIV